jgi:hypothetical protein
MAGEINSEVFELNKLLSGLDSQGGFFIDFISTKGIKAGIVRLHLTYAYSRIQVICV